MTIKEEQRRFQGDSDNANVRPQMEDNRQNEFKPQVADNVRISGPINVGANQTRPRYNFKPAIPQQEEESEDEDEEEEDESEDERQKKIQPAQNQQRQNVRKEPESDDEEDEDEEDAIIPRGAKPMATRQVVTKQVTRVVQPVPRKQPTKPESSEEETEEEESEEEDIPPVRPPQKASVPPPASKVPTKSTAAPPSKRQTAAPSKAPQGRVQQPVRPQPPPAESEESEEEESEEEESEEEIEMATNKVNGNATKPKQAAPPTRSLPMGLSKPVQQQPTRPDSESDDDDDDDEEEEEQSYAVQQKVILPSQKIEARYASRTIPEKRDQLPAPNKRSIESHRLSPVNFPPPLPITSPPRGPDEEDDDDYDDEDDVSDGGYGEQFPTKVTNMTIAAPNKQSEIITKTSTQGNKTRTVVTRTVVTTKRVPIPVESDEDDVDEEYDDEGEPAHGAETDI